LASELFYANTITTRLSTTDLNGQGHVRDPLLHLGDPNVAASHFTRVAGDGDNERFVWVAGGRGRHSALGGNSVDECEVALQLDRTVSKPVQASVEDSRGGLGDMRRFVEKVMRSRVEEGIPVPARIMVESAYEGGARGDRTR